MILFERGADMEQAAVNLVELLKASGMTCAVAESCTGGGVGSAITAVPGSSEVFLGGVISYSNGVKEKLLGVPPETLAECGAVSPECAAAMAEGVRRATGADVAVSVTGVAGPGGGSAAKPVGLVWFAIAAPQGTRSEKALFPGDRDAVRKCAVAHALGMLSVAAVR